MSGGGPATLASYDASLAWNVSYHFNEPSGTTVINSGSLASGDATWTPGSGPPVGALGQTGQRGAGEAYSLNGVDSIITGPTSTTINNATAFTYLFLLNMATGGESNAGFLATDNGQNRPIFFATGVSPFRINWVVSAAGSSATATSAGGSGIASATWMTAAFTYNDASDRKGHIYFGTSSGLAEATYSSQTAATGALSNGSGALLVGNRAATDRTTDGLFDEFRYKNAALTLAQLQEWNRLVFL